MPYESHYPCPNKSFVVARAVARSPWRLASIGPVPHTVTVKLFIVARADNPAASGGSRKNVALDYHELALGSCIPSPFPATTHLQAAKRSNAHRFIMQFPDGYETLCGEKGAMVWTPQRGFPRFGLRFQRLPLLRLELSCSSERLGARQG